MAGHLFEYQLQHHPVQARRPAKPLKPRQETAGRDRVAMTVDQAREHFVMQDQLRILAGHHRLEVQLEAVLGQRPVQHHMLTQRRPSRQQRRVTRHGAIDVQPRGKAAFQIGHGFRPVGVAKGLEFISHHCILFAQA